MSEPTDSSANPADSASNSPADALLRWAVRYRWWIFGLIALIYVAGFNGQWHIAPDTALYAIVGRNVAEGQGYVHPLGDQQELTPGLPWLIAGCFKLFGQGFFAPHVAMWFCSVATLVLFYHLIQMNAGPAAAVAITYMLAVTERFYRYAFDVMADGPFLFGVTLFLAGYEAIWHNRHKKPWPWIAMLVGGLTMALFRSVVLVFFAGLIVAAVWHLIRRRHVWKHVAVVLLFAASCLLARAVDPRVENVFQLTRDERIAQDTLGMDVAKLVDRVREHNMPELFETAAPEALFGVELGPVVNTLVVLVVLALAASLVLHRVLWACIVLAFIAQLIVFHYVVPRYFLPILPLLIAAAWLGADGLNKTMRQPIGGWIAIFLMFAWTAPNLVKVGATIIEQRRGDFYAHFQNGTYKSIDLLGKGVQEVTAPTDWLLIRDPVWRQPLTYFTRRKVIPLQRLAEILPGEDVVYYVEQGLRRLPRRVESRRTWKFDDPIVVVGRGENRDPWTLRRLTYRPAARQDVENPATNPQPAAEIPPEIGAD